MAGNCEQYISVFFAAARVGAIPGCAQQYLYSLRNNTYTPSELYYALNHSGRTRPVHREAVAMLTRTQNADCSL
jgi:long-chain acyl-CoA synthetase